jgi:two-component system, cell cycle sensor histidine kinase and response regulator CckA
MNQKEQEAMGRVSQEVAHDSNNLLSGILGYAQLILNDPAIEHLKPYIEEMIRAGKRIADLNRILLIFSTRHSEVAEALDLNAAIQGMEKFIPLILGPEIHFSTVQASGIWPILADSIRIQRALFDLAIEIRDRIPNGGKFTLKTENMEAAPNGIPESPQDFKRYVCITAQIAATHPKGLTPLCINDSLSKTKSLSHENISGFPNLDAMARSCGGFIATENTTEREIMLQIFLPAISKSD